jgi:hypothetical protein
MSFNVTVADSGRRIALRIYRTAWRAELMIDDWQTAYDWIEGADEKTAGKFHDWLWNKHRKLMRSMILTYVETDGREAFQAYLAYMESPENQANLKADYDRDVEGNR